MKRTLPYTLLLVLVLLLSIFSSGAFAADEGTGQIDVLHVEGILHDELRTEFSTTDLRTKVTVDEHAELAS